MIMDFFEIKIEAIEAWIVLKVNCYNINNRRVSRSRIKKLDIKSNNNFSMNYDFMSKVKITKVSPLEPQDTSIEPQFNPF